MTKLDSYFNMGLIT